jgi:hypothetical protein
VAEPGLHGADVHPGAEPASRGGVAEAVQVPLGRIQPSPLGYGLSKIVQETRACDAAAVLRRRKEGGAGVKALGLRPSEKRFYVLGGYFAHVGLGGDVLREELQDVLVFLPGERLAEGFDVL